MGIAVAGVVFCAVVASATLRYWIYVRAVARYRAASNATHDEVIEYAITIAPHRPW